MKEMTHEQASFWLATYMDTLTSESRITRRVIEAVPHDRLDYRPDPFAKTANELARHIAGADNRFVEAVTQGRFDTAWTIPETVTSPAELADWYGTRYSQNLKALAAASPEQLVKVVDFRGMFQWPALAFLTFGLHHTIHHRGQLSAYLQSMGGKVPAIYGESYDSAEARKATTA